MTGASSPFLVSRWPDLRRSDRSHHRDACHACVEGRARFHVPQRPVHSGLPAPRAPARPRILTLPSRPGKPSQNLGGPSKLSALQSCGGNCTDEMVMGMCVLAIIVVSAAALRRPAVRALSSALSAWATDRFLEAPVRYHSFGDLPLHQPDIGSAAIASSRRSGQLPALRFRADAQALLPILSSHC